MFYAKTMYSYRLPVQLLIYFRVDSFLEYKLHVSTEGLKFINCKQKAKQKLVKLLR